MLTGQEILKIEGQLRVMSFRSVAELLPGVARSNHVLLYQLLKQNTSHLQAQLKKLYG